jgi:UPF0755 protein
VVRPSPDALAASPLDFTIEPGSSMRQVARQLVDAGIDVQPVALEVLARVTRQANAIKAGSYEVEAGSRRWRCSPSSPAATSARRSWRSSRAGTSASCAPPSTAIRICATTAPASATPSCWPRIGSTASHPEGLFFPDTYLFSRRSSDLDVLRRAHRHMLEVLDREWAGAPAGCPTRPLPGADHGLHRREGNRPGRRPPDGGLGVRQPLRSGMLLQTDPTVIYGLGEAFDGNLRKRDLLADTPYNTYTRPGLPPTPIAMPGVAALRAALNPPATDYLYFVARGDGSSEFSRTLDEHNRAVAQYIRKRNP